MESYGLVALQVAVLAVMLVGLFGLLTTIIPGLAIIWVAALVYWLVTGFEVSSGIVFGVMTVLTIGGSLLDNVIMGASARRTGASWLAIGVALVGGLVGSLAFPPFGGLVAALLGLFAVEFIRLRDWRQAMVSTRGMAVGCGWSAILRFGVGLILIALWGGWVLLS